MLQNLTSIPIIGSIIIVSIFNSCKPKIHIATDKSCKIIVHTKSSFSNDEYFQFEDKAIELKTFPNFNNDKNIGNYKIEVYNDSGILCFKSNNPNEYWVKDNVCPINIKEGNYYYLLKMKLNNDSLENSFNGKFRLVIVE